jgi:lipopolysaccharide export system protein LptC
VTIRGAAGFLVLLGIAGGTFYLANSLDEDEPEEARTPRIEEGFYLRAARILGTGPNGRPLYEVEAEYAEQRPNNMIQFENVRVVYTPESGVPWTLNADSALISGNQERLVLEGHVVAVGTEGLNGEETEIRTPWLELEPKLYRAETDQRVQVRIGSRSLTATGMLALLQDNEFRLKSNVSGKFVP